jgi:hypothetical protein
MGGKALPTVPIFLFGVGLLPGLAVRSPDSVLEVTGPEASVAPTKYVGDVIITLYKDDDCTLSRFHKRIRPGHCIQTNVDDGLNRYGRSMYSAITSNKPYDHAYLAHSGELYMCKQGCDAKKCFQKPVSWSDGECTHPEMKLGTYVSSVRLGNPDASLQFFQNPNCPDWFETRYFEIWQHDVFFGDCFATIFPVMGLGYARISDNFQLEYCKDKVCAQCNKAPSTYKYNKCVDPRWIDMPADLPHKALRIRAFSIPESSTVFDDPDCVERVKILHLAMDMLSDADARVTTIHQLERSCETPKQNLDLRSLYVPLGEATVPEVPQETVEETEAEVSEDDEGSSEEYRDNEVSSVHRSGWTGPENTEYAQADKDDEVSSLHRSGWTDPEYTEYTQANTQYASLAETNWEASKQLGFDGFVGYVTVYKDTECRQYRHHVKVTGDCTPLLKESHSSKYGFATIKMGGQVSICQEGCRVCMAGTDKVSTDACTVVADGSSYIKAVRVGPPEVSVQFHENPSCPNIYDKRKDRIWQMDMFLGNCFPTKRQINIDLDYGYIFLNDDGEIALRACSDKACSNCQPTIFKQGQCTNAQFVGFPSHYEHKALRIKAWEPSEASTVYTKFPQCNDRVTKLHQAMDAVKNAISGVRRAVSLEPSCPSPKQDSNFKRLVKNLEGNLAMLQAAPRYLTGS